MESFGVGLLDIGNYGGRRDRQMTYAIRGGGGLNIGSIGDGGRMNMASYGGASRMNMENAGGRGHDDM